MTRKAAARLRVPAMPAAALGYAVRIYMLVYPYYVQLLWPLS